MTEIFVWRMSIFLILSMILSYITCSAQTKEDISRLKKTAFVVGNDRYSSNEELNNAVNDAVEVAAALRRLGFDPKLDTNQNLENLSNDITRWLPKVRSADVALFYFAGHGAQISGINYLYPTDAIFSTDSEIVKQYTYSAAWLLQQMTTVNGKINILILDACRDNPVRGLKRSLTKNGLADMKYRQQPGILIGYPVYEGQTTPDGTGNHSLFTKAILDHIEEPNTSIKKIFGEVTDEVYRLSGNKQLPFINTSIGNENDIYLKYRDPHEKTGSKELFQNKEAIDELNSFRKEESQITATNQSVPEDTLAAIYAQLMTVANSARNVVIDSLGKTRFTGGTGNRPDFAHFKLGYVFSIYGINYTERRISAILTLEIGETSVEFTIVNADDEGMNRFQKLYNPLTEPPLPYHRGEIDWDEIKQTTIRYFFNRKRMLLGNF